MLTKGLQASPYCAVEGPARNEATAQQVCKGGWVGEINGGQSVSALYMFLHIAAVEPLPCKNGDLAGNVHAGEVITGVGLRVAGCLRLRNDLAEAGSLNEVVEDVAERAAENALHLETRKHWIPRLD